MAVLIETRLNALKLNESANPRKGCLGRLEGICADFKNPTRNGRLYTRKLWENVFNDPIFKESLESKTLLGELDHPEDRLEVLAGEACIVMTDYRIDDDEGVIYAGFDILDTPRGKILKTLLDYGCVMGVSSRGQGDITTTSSGETVDEDTYDFACFDVVTTPAVEKARQNVVESVGKTKRFVESIRTQIKEAETIGDLNAIKKVVESTQTPELDSLLESIQNKCNSIQEGKTITSESVKELQHEEPVETKISGADTQKNNSSAKTIRENKELYHCVNDLRKQISAYKHRENRLLQVIQSKDEQITHLQGVEEQLRRSKSVNSKLQKENKYLSSTNTKTVHRLQESLSNKDQRLNSLKTSMLKREESIQGLQEQLQDSENNVKSLKKSVQDKDRNVSSLRESVRKKDVQIERLNHSVLDYQKNLSDKEDTIRTLENTVHQLEEQLTTLQSDMELSEQQTTQDTGKMELEINSYTELVDQLHEKVKDLQSKLDESVSTKNKLNRSVKHLSEQLTKYQHNYVHTKSKQLGVDPNMVQKFVTVDTTVSQINKLVEDLQDTKDRYAKLPFSESAPKGVVVESSTVTKKDPEEERLTRFIEQVIHAK